MTGGDTILADLRRAVADHRENLSRGGTPVIGWCCSYVPVEVLESAKLVPFRLLPQPPAEMGDACLTPNFCPYVRALMGEGLAGTYSFLSGLVIMNTCDNMRRLFDVWSHFRRPLFIHLMDLPRVTTPPAIDYFRGEIQSLLDRLSSTFGVSVSPEDLAVSFRASNKTRALLRKAEDLVRRGRVGMTGLEWTEFSRAGGLLPRKIYDGFLRRLIDQSRAGPERNGVPILLTGSMLENPEIVAMIEECGGRVVAQDLCVSGRQSEEPISLTQDPLAALARHYLLRPPCARMQENRRRIDHVMSLVRSHGVRGVVYYVLKFCDTFLYEAPVLKRRLAQAGIPMLIIESDYQGGRGGGIYTRVQAFLEMLGVRAAQATCEAGV